jgi:hypothetical protein
LTSHDCVADECQVNAGVEIENFVGNSLCLHHIRDGGKRRCNSTIAVLPSTGSCGRKSSHCSRHLVVNDRHDRCDGGFRRRQIGRERVQRQQVETCWNCKNFGHLVRSEAELHDQG